MNSSAKPVEYTEETVRIPSAGLLLEGLLTYPSATDEGAPAVLLCPPHPFLGGDMNGNVLRALRSEFSTAGWITLSFNYRGIGASQTDMDLRPHQEEFWIKSTCPGYEKKMFEDAASALFYLESISKNTRLHLVGYSFGCLAALELASATAVAAASICLISPPLKQWSFSASQLSVDIPKMICYSPGDFACPVELSERMYEDIAEPKTQEIFEGCDHFYLGREPELAKSVIRFAANHVGKM